MREKRKFDNGYGEHKSLHMKSVADIMRDNAQALGINPSEAFVVGILHDVGYIDSKEHHEQAGAELLTGMGLKPEYIHAVRYHGINGYTLLDKDIEITPMLLLLQYADMSVNRLGDKIGFGGRLYDIKKRYDIPEAYPNAKATVDFVTEVFDIKFGEIQPMTQKEFNDKIEMIKNTRINQQNKDDKNEGELDR